MNNLNDDNIVCFVDGYDVLCTRNSEELIYEFNKLKNEKKFNKFNI